MNYTNVASPIGELLLVSDDSGLRAIGFPEGKGRVTPESGWSRGSDKTLDLAAAQLEEYFSGGRQTFKLPLAPTGTPFQLAVLDALLTVPYGATCSYADIAVQIGRPKAVRAIGAANGRNPLPIVIPCHRVIGSTGALVGFGGGLDAKQRLLDLESRGRTDQGSLFAS